MNDTKTIVDIFKESEWGDVELLDEVIEGENIITLEQMGSPISIPKDKFKEFIHWLSTRRIK